MVEYFVLMFSFYYSNACLRFTRYNEHYILQNQSGENRGLCVAVEFFSKKTVIRPSIFK